SPSNMRSSSHRGIGGSGRGMDAVTPRRLLIGTTSLAFSVGLCLYTANASSAPQAAQDQPPAPPPPTFRTEANCVRVDVYPTRNDAPVVDLTRDDFEVLDNGAPQKIEQFERVVVRAAGPQESRI